jgi:hypothetical protein
MFSLVLAVDQIVVPVPITVRAQSNDPISISNLLDRRAAIAALCRCHILLRHDLDP